MHLCEDILRSEKHYNIEHNILPSETAVADRLLTRRLELAGAYKELYDKLHGRPAAVRAFLGALLRTAAFWNPEQIVAARGNRERLGNVNRQIASKAAELAKLLEARSELHNHSCFTTNTHYHVCEVIEAAAKDNYLFGSYVREALHALRGQFDLKYWPTLNDVLEELARDAEEASLEATNPITSAATTAMRSSRADFFKALFAAIEENSHNRGLLPRGFKLTDNTLASFTNCALDLGPDDLVDGAYVKRLRQRERDAAGSGRRAAGKGF